MIKIMCDYIVLPLTRQAYKPSQIPDKRIINVPSVSIQETSIITDEGHLRMYEK